MAGMCSLKEKAGVEETKDRLLRLSAQVGRGKRRREWIASGKPKGSAQSAPTKPSKERGIAGGEGDGESFPRYRWQLCS